MNFDKRDIGLVVGGGVIGAVICGATIVKKLISSETFGPFIAKALADKIVDSLDDEDIYRRRQRHVSYSRYYDAVDKSDREFDTSIIFETRENAEEALKTLHKLYKMNNCVTVYDLYALTGFHTDYMSNRYGWTKEIDLDVEIVENRNGYMIELPKPERFY